MLELLKQREDFKHACERASKRAVEQECTVFVSYVARHDVFRISDWYDDASVIRFDESSELEWL
jgi:hypothetical protein